MTVIRLLNNQAATKEEGNFFQGMLSMAVLVICILISKAKVMVSLRTADVSAAMSEEKRLPFAG